MRTFKPQRRTADGQIVPYDKFYAELRTADGRILRLPGFTSERLTESLGRNVQRLIDCRASGETLPQDTAKWIETLPHQTAKILTRWGLLRGHALAAGEPLSKHIADWKADLLARGNTAKHANLSAGRVERLTVDCGFKFYSDVSAAKAQQRLADYRKDTLDANGNAERGTGIKTTNYYLRDLKSFCRWMMRDRRATSNPVEYLDALNAKTDIRRQRRALCAADMRSLLDVARHGPERCGISGPERALVYELAATTGLRASELASLTAASFTLGDSPSVTIDAAYAKNRRRDTLPLRADMAGLLREFLAAKLPGVTVFPKLNNDHTAEMLRADLEAANLPFELDGKYFDFHALRHQFISGLAAAGVHPKTAQQLARHSTITLTMDNYTHVFRGDLDKAVDALPDWHTAGPEQARATGTDSQATTVGHAPLARLAATANPAMRLTDSMADQGQGLKTAVTEPGENSPASGENCGALCGALLCTEAKRTVAPGSANAEYVQGEEKPIDTHETRMDKGTGRGRIRTCVGISQRIYSPPDNNHNPLVKLALTETPKGRMARNGAREARQDARLMELADCWAELPESIKAAIVLIAKSAKGPVK